MEWEKFTPINPDNFTPTELRMPVIRACLYDTVGRLIEAEGYKFKKSDYTYKRKHGKSYEQIMFLFYDYFPLNYSFTFLTYVFNETIENIKLSLPPQDHFQSFNRYSLFIPIDYFTHHIKSKSLGELGRDYQVITLDDLMDVANAIDKTFKEEVFPLLDILTTIDGIDVFFTKRGVKWAVDGDSLNHICTDLIAAKLNGKRDYHMVFEEIVQAIKATEKPNLQTVTVIENLYEYLGNGNVSNLW
jgi:hypothetical protein